MELDLNIFFASGDLEGKVVDGCTVVSKLASPDRAKHETGGNISTCYKVEKDGESAFMKRLGLPENNDDERGTL